MEKASAIHFAHGIARILNRTDLANCEAWQRAFQNRCKDHRFYEIVDETLDTFEHLYLLLEDNDGKIRAIQPLFIVRQNLAEGVRGKFRNWVGDFQKRFPRFLTMRILMVGCAAGEGHLGTCAPNDVEWVSSALHACLPEVARHARASLVVLKDFPTEYRSTLQAFSRNGYTRVPSMPMTRLKLGYATFDQYLATLSHATRKGLRRKFRKTERSAPIEMEVMHDITPYVDEIYPLYLQVHERSSMKFERLTKSYLCNLGQRMPERTRFFIWRQRGKAIAFSLCMVFDGTIYDEYLGLDYSVALDLHLYFYTVRAILSWALDHGLHSYCSSPLNYDPKLHLGCELVPLDLYVMHTASFLNPIFGRAVKLLEPTRHDPVLKRFANADQL